MSTKGSSGDVHYAENNNDVKEAIDKVTNAELRIQLFRNMEVKGRFTRNILSFANKQAHIIHMNKELDRNTIKHAMRAKVLDAE